MKKVFGLFGLTILLALITNIQVFAQSWSELNQDERSLYIENCIKDINSTEEIKISDEVLKNTFQLTTSKDPNFKRHKNGETSLENIKIQLKTWNYLLPGPHKFSERGANMAVVSGYYLIDDNIILDFNQNGNLIGIITKQKTSSNNLITRKYNRNQKLQTIIYRTANYEIYLKNNGNVDKIKYQNKFYDMNGKLIK